VFHFGSQTIAVNVPNRATLLCVVRERFAAQQGFALATINLDHLVKLRRSEGFQRAYAAQDLIVADGNPVVWLSRLAGHHVDLIPGSELVRPLAREAAMSGVRVAMIGSTETALAEAAAQLKTEFPGLDVALRIAPPMGFDPAGEAATAMLRQVAEQGIGLCFLALGAPKQEAMAALGRQLSPATGFVSVGAGLDFIAGTQIRAPWLFRRTAMEWFWRALTSPRRLGPRYLACAAILPGQTLAALRLRWAD
jgi:N-acetylglucosaminyldiphosphoundecaprenol N-acetyl-beta-D-mannosaminyltransferase